jgi:beta-glucosidase
LPVTFYKASEKLPPFDDYAMRGRTYRYFEGEPLYPFGHGLSYTHFAYAGLTLDRSEAAPADRVQVSLTVRNSGQRAGDEVVQLYLHPLDPKRPRASKELRGFQRIHLEPGQSRRVSFAITPAADLHYYDTDRHAYAVDPGRYEVQLGASSADIRLRGTLTVKATP